MSSYIRKEILRIQFPSNCNQTKFMYCGIPNNCGGACNLHQMIYCFYVAFATDEEVLGSQWTKIEIFVRGAHSRFVNWATTDGDHQDVPLWVPHIIAPKLKKYHYKYGKWMVGQLASYLLRVNPKTQSQMDLFNSKLTIFESNRTKIGIHVRRTDKIQGPNAEAKLIQLSKYVDQANLFMNKTFPQWESNQTVKPIIYLATDDTNVITEAHNYRNYDWVVFTDGEHMSGQIPSRTSLLHTYALISDLFYLSRCDYFIGTFSSQVSRLASELFQYTHLEGFLPNRKEVSLDHVWYFP